MSENGAAARRRRAAIGTVVFTLTVPGTVVVLLPWLLSGWPPASGSAAVALSAALLALGFHLFVVLYEEPTLPRRFAAEYDDYCRRVPRWWPRLTRVLLVACALSGPLACASTRIETQWKDPAVTPQDLAFRKVIALAQVEDETTRRAAEDELVRVIAAGPKAMARGMQVEPAYASISSAELGDVTALRAKVEAAGFDGAVVLRLVSDQERVTYVPGRYEVMWGTVVRHDPGYTTVDRIVRVETSLYSITQGRRLWSGVSRTLNPRDLPDLVDEVVRAVGAELEAQGLAP